MDPVENSLQPTNQPNTLIDSANEYILPEVLWGIVLNFMSDSGQNCLSIVHPDIAKALAKNRTFYSVNLTSELNLAQKWISAKITQLKTMPQFHYQQTMLEEIVRRYPTEIDPNKLPNYSELKTRYQSIKCKLFKIVNVEDALNPRIPLESGPLPFDNLVPFTDNSHLTRTMRVNEYANAMYFCFMRNGQDCIELINYFLIRDMHEEALQTFLNYCSQNKAWHNFPSTYKAFELLRDYLSTEDSEETQKIVDTIKNIPSPRVQFKILTLVLESLVTEGNYKKAFELIEKINPEENYSYFLEIPLQALIDQKIMDQAYEIVPKDTENNLHIREHLLRLVIQGFIAQKNMSKALELLPTLPFYNQDTYRLITKGYLELGETEKALEYAKISSKKFDNDLHLHEVEEEILLMKVEKFILENNMDEAQKVFSQMRMSKSVAKLEYLADFYYHNNSVIANTIYNPNRGVQIRLTSEEPLQHTVLFRILLAMNKLDLLKKFIPHMDKFEYYYEGSRIAIKRGNIAQALELVKKIPNERHEPEENPALGIIHKDRMLERIVFHVLQTGNTVEALKIAETIIDNNYQTKAYLEIVTILIEQKNIEEARKIADIIPREGAKKIAAQKIAAFLAKKTEQVTTTPAPTPAPTSTPLVIEETPKIPDPLPIIEQPVIITPIPNKTETSQPPIPPQTAATNRFSHIRNAYNWIALKIMSFVATVFTFIRSVAIAIYTLPTRIISYRRVPARN